MGTSGACQSDADGGGRGYRAGMHRSRVGVVLVDMPDEVYDEVEAFWSAAVGLPVERENETYARVARLDGTWLELQRTGPGTPPRIHLDVETDDVGAETARLVALGATVTERHDDYVVLADPGGHPFCVVPVQTGAAFEAHAHAWD